MACSTVVSRVDSSLLFGPCDTLTILRFLLHSTLDPRVQSAH